MSYRCSILGPLAIHSPQFAGADHRCTTGSASWPGRKFTSTVMATATGLPSLIAGSKCHFRTVSTASSLSSLSSLAATWALHTYPVSLMTAMMVTVRTSSLLGCTATVALCDRTEEMGGGGGQLPFLIFSPPKAGTQRPITSTAIPVFLIIRPFSPTPLHATRRPLCLPTLRTRARAPNPQRSLLQPADTLSCLS